MNEDARHRTCACLSAGRPMLCRSCRARARMCRPEEAPEANAMARARPNGAARTYLSSVDGRGTR